VIAVIARVIGKANFHYGGTETRRTAKAGKDKNLHTKEDKGKQRGRSRVIEEFLWRRWQQEAGFLSLLPASRGCKSPANHAILTILASRQQALFCATGG